jgi:hypothetical protein
MTDLLTTFPTFPTSPRPCFTFNLVEENLMAVSCRASFFRWRMGALRTDDDINKKRLIISKEVLSACCIE